MVKKQNFLARPVLMAVLIAGAFSAQAAEREVLKAIP